MAIGCDLANIACGIHVTEIQDKPWQMILLPMRVEELFFTQVIPSKFVQVITFGALKTRFSKQGMKRFLDLLSQ